MGEEWKTQHREKSEIVQTQYLLFAVEEHALKHGSPSSHGFVVVVNFRTPVAQRSNLDSHGLSISLRTLHRLARLLNFLKDSLEGYRFSVDIC